MTLRATEARVRWQPTSALTRASAVCVSGAIWTTSATNPAAWARRRSRSGSTAPSCGGNDTNASPASCPMWTFGASARGWVSGTATDSMSGITTSAATSAGTTSQRPSAMSVSPWTSFFIAGWAKFWLDSSSWIRGRRDRTTRASRATRSCVDTPANAIRTSPVSPSPADRTTASARRKAARTSFAGSTRAWPPVVRLTDRVLRSNSWMPNSRSSCLIVRLSGGWAMCSRSAARPKCSSSATARNARICWTSIIVETVSQRD